MMQGKQNRIPLPKEESLITQMLSKYITYWPVFLLFMVLAVTGAYIYLRYTTPMFEATATLIIKDEKKGYEDKGMESLNMISTKKIIENEVEVLQSRTLMDNVVKNLHLYAPVFVQGKVRAISAYTISPVQILVSDPDSIKETKKVHFTYDQAKGAVSLETKYAGSINEWLSTPYGRLKFIPNKRFEPSNVTSGTQFYFSLVQTNDVTKGILNSLKATPASKLSSVINLSYRDEIPQRAEDILNQLIVTYDRAAIDEKNSLAKNTLEFVDERLGFVKHDLDSVEKNVQQYKAATGATDISTQGQIYLQSVGATDQKISEYNAQLAAVNQVEKALTTGSDGGIMPAAMGLSDPTLTTQMNNLNNAEMEYEKLRKTVAENNPILVAVRDQIEKLRPAIILNVQNQRKNLEASKANLAITNNNYTSRLSAIPQKERQLVEMTRDQNTKNGIYSFLLQKKEESELSYASTLSDSRVVNKAQSSKAPVSPNKLLIYIAAVAIAFAICISVISAREAFSRKVLYRNEIENLTSVPIIGEVAFNTSKDELVIQAGKRSFIAEEFRKIRVSLHFLGIDANHKKILVTSSIPGEGKSFIAANLAISNSLSGKKVVLVDLDLHNPGLGRIFDKSTADAGMSDYLTGDKDPEDIIKRVPNHDNLFFVSSGTLHESPSELLLNGKVKEFITYLEGIFDLVILDTAPVVLVTDAFVLSGYSDATLYVVRHKYTPKMLVKRIEENLRINPLTNPAIIFNGVKTRGFFKNNYGYGYDYVYGDKQRNKQMKEKKALAKNLS